MMLFSIHIYPEAQQTYPQENKGVALRGNEGFI